MPRYVTVVFEINDEEAFKAEMPGLAEKMNLNEGAPWRVTGMALDDELTRQDLMEEANEHPDGQQAIRDIIRATNISDKSIQDFIDMEA